MEITVKLILEGYTVQDILKDADDWIVKKDGDLYISVDWTQMETDPRDDSFYLFKLTNPCVVDGKVISLQED